MSQPKTQKSNASVTGFLDTIKDEQKRKGSHKLLEIFKEVTGKDPKMWGKSIIGFGEYHYKYESGREGDWPITGFSPRKQNLTIYLMCGCDLLKEQLKKLGKHKTSVSCLYIKKLSDIDVDVLKELIKKNMEEMKKNYETV